jgi:biopolymer transport protein ExbD
MSEVQQQDSGGSDKKHKKVRAKKSSTHIDMTPMVDLAFLLLTFFMLTTTFSKPKTMEINMPDKEAKPEEQQKIKESQALTILLTANNKIVWYTGLGDDPEKPPVTNIADFSLNSPRGIHKVILERNQDIFTKVQLTKDSIARGILDEVEGKRHIAGFKGVKDGLVVLIKPDSTAKYKNVVDILDEMNVCAVGRFAIVDITDSEKELLKSTN